MRSRVAWILALLVAAALAAILLLPQRESDSREIVIAQFGDLLLYAPLYIAADTGEFRKQGLNVRIISTGGDDKTFAAVASGDAQFGIADPTFAAIANERGGGGAVVGLLINGMPNYGVSGRQDAAAITDLKQLVGKRFASVPAPSTSYAALASLYRRAGTEPVILQSAPAGLFAAAKEPDVAGAVLIEPWVSQIELEGGKVVLSLPQFFGEFALTGLTTTHKVRNDDPDAVRRVQAALRAAVATFYDDPGRTLEVAIRRFPKESRQSLERGLARMRRDRVYSRDLRMTRPAWDAAVRLRIESGDYRGTVETSWASVAPEAR